MLVARFPAFGCHPSHASHRPPGVPQASVGVPRFFAPQEVAARQVSLWHTEVKEFEETPEKADPASCPCERC